ncbi:MAG: hypothetical protein ABSH33_01550 [Steroidobacteraceae bacterium]|jgi:hypothetical protein
MNEFMVIFSIAASGCLVRLSTDLVLQLLARKAPSGTIAMGPHHGHAPDHHQKVDPVMALGLTLTCYGAISLALVSELPGALAFQRTWLAFALLCAGGLIGEISRTGGGGGSAASAESDADADDLEPKERTTGSVGLSVALMLALNLAVAVLSSGQGLVQIVPPPAPTSDNQSPELEQIVVVARRGTDELGSSTFL